MSGESRKSEEVHALGLIGQTAWCEDTGFRLTRQFLRSPDLITARAR